MRYDIEADWYLLNTCSYRCDYCFFSSDLLGQKLPSFATSDEWVRSYDATGKTWLLHLTGGEPSIYPGFVDLCKQLIKRHYLSINSNLAHSSICDFAKQIPPSRISFINAGLHPVERRRRGGEVRFLENADLLRRKNFPIFVSLVATPEALISFDEAISFLEPIDLFPIPKLLRGERGGRQYPKDYGENEMGLFRYYASLARAFYAPVIQRMDERPSIDIFLDDQILEGEPSFKGQVCDAGSRFVHIRPNGDVFRCSDILKLGNILEGSVRFASTPSTCNTSYCFYFCRKYARPPNQETTQ